MKASEIRFEEFLSQPKTNFLIPVYQRNYDWLNTQCNEFIKDIEVLARQEKDNHFLGSVVYIKGDDTEALERGLKEYIIIDGQQRITTIMLFLKAIYDLSQDKWEKEEIFENFLINKIRGSNKLKLKPIKNDNEIFEKLLNNIDLDKNQNSRILINYRLFKNHIENSDINIGKYFQAFRRIWIVYIELDREKDDPQLIFESINSTGLSLSEADLIRNFILMDKKHEEQYYLFEEYWSKIEKLLTSEKISSFIRDYLTMKESNIPKQNEVYISFKRYSLKLNINTEDLLKDLLYYSNIYSKFLYLNDDNKKISKIIKELQDLKVTVAFPYLLNLFSDLNQNIIDEVILVKSIKLIRDYVFRRLICEYNTNTLNKVFMTLHKELISIENYKDNYYECLASILIGKRGTAMFPRDEEFKQYFTTKNIYKFKNKNYLLYSLESFENKELVPFSDLTIEHVMPQKLTTKWEIELGNKSKEVHEKYLHNIGNLTLSGYNSNLSNKSFSDKKEIIKNSGIKLNKYFESLSSWDKEEIEKRAEFLYENIALTIWKFPIIKDSLFIKSEVQEFYTLNDSADVTGTKPKKIKIDNEVLVIKKRSWIECFTQFNNYLYNYDTELFESFIFDDDFQGRERRIITNHSELCRKPIKLNDNVNIYIESNLSATAILKYMKLISEKYGLEDDDVIFYVG